MAIDWSKISDTHKGKWVALRDDEQTVIASADTAADALDAARAKGYQSPLLGQMPVVDDQVKILKTAIEELRLFYGHVSNIYDQLRIKTLALIAGEVAIVTFVFVDKYQFPHEHYIRLFFFAGVGALIVAFGILLWIISSLDWKIPYELRTADKLRQKFSTELEFLEFLNDDYIASINSCRFPVGVRAKRINWAIYLLAAGVTIVLIVKFGG